MWSRPIEKDEMKRPNRCLISNYNCNPPLVHIAPQLLLTCWWYPSLGKSVGSSPWHGSLTSELFLTLSLNLSLWPSTKSLEWDIESLTQDSPQGNMCVLIMPKDNAEVEKGWLLFFRLLSLSYSLSLQFSSSSFQFLYRLRSFLYRLRSFHMNSQSLKCQSLLYPWIHNLYKWFSCIPFTGF